jgi:hypothetical protein
MFSIEQTITQLSLWSRMTSSSNSPHPMTDWSSRTWPIGLGVDAAGHDRAELLLGVRRAAAAPAERERRADDRRQPDHLEVGHRLLDGVGDRAARHPQAGLLHRLGEELAVLRAADRVVVRADELDAVLLQRAVLVQRAREVQRGLAAERRQQRVGALLRDDLGDGPGQERLDVGRVGELRVGHDRRRVRVDQHDLVALLLEDLARLTPE